MMLERLDSAEEAARAVLLLGKLIRQNRKRSEFEAPAQPVDTDGGRRIRGAVPHRPVQPKGTDRRINGQTNLEQACPAWYTMGAMKRRVI
ncbi:hypothetical protein [Ruthenibacterium lactatiformans]|uniref:hypothetical protein n=1 Tax=Ruthenibacterium lactatiformans TaxID=1550024 RepID=UPI0035228FA1